MFEARECPHLYGLPGSGMCTLAEESVEHGADGRTNFSCSPIDQADFNTS